MKNNQITIHEHDLWALANFRSTLVRELSKNHTIDVLCLHDNFSGGEARLSPFVSNIVGPFSPGLFGLFCEIYARGRSLYSQNGVTLVFGLRTALIVSFLFLLTKAKGASNNRIVLVPGLGRAGKLNIRILRFMGTMIRKSFSHVFVLNQHDLESLFRGNPSSVEILPSEGIEISEKFNPSPKEDRCIYFGRIIKDKGIFHLIENFPSDLDLDIFGYGSQKNIERINGAIKDAPRIKFLGHTDKIHSKLAPYRFAIVPTQYNEGFPMVILESILAGCLPIVVKIPQISHLTDHVPKLLTLEKNFGSEDLALIIRQYVQNPELANTLMQELREYVILFHCKTSINKKILEKIAKSTN